MEKTEKKTQACSFKGMDLLDRIAKIKTRFGGEGSPNMFLDLSSSKASHETSFCESGGVVYLRTTFSGPDGVLLSMFLPLDEWPEWKANMEKAVQSHQDFHKQFPGIETA